MSSGVEYLQKKKGRTLREHRSVIVSASSLSSFLQHQGEVSRTFTGVSLQFFLGNNEFLHCLVPQVIFIELAQSVLRSHFACDQDVLRTLPSKSILDTLGMIPGRLVLSGNGEGSPPLLIYYYFIIIVIIINCSVAVSFVILCRRWRRISFCF